MKGKPVIINQTKSSQEKKKNSFSTQSHNTCKN